MVLQEFEMATRIDTVGGSVRNTGDRVPTFVARVLNWLDSRQRISRTTNELGVLTDRELDDIGLTRADIGRVAREGASRA
jgi:uncharacterized protein YjiS (DUF1127 family)